MKVVGEAAARGSVETVWGALHDAATLARAIPGCEHFEVSGPGLGQFIATTALPAISGTYAGKLTVAEQQRPSLLRLTLSVTGDQGTIVADATLRLSDAPDTTTLVSYEASGTVTGQLAAAGTRLLTSAAKRLANEFFAIIDETVAARTATPSSAAAEPVATESVVTAESVATAGTVAAAEPVATGRERAVSADERPRTLARPGPLADNRAALVAGAAIGLAGIVIGVLAGRRGGRADRVRP